jgi:class 3 adenylate cyclase
VGADAELSQPETQYVSVGDGMVAYQVLGAGPLDVVVLASIASNVDVQWEYPALVRQRRRLASFSRLIMFDRRGTGLSDPVPFEELGTYEHFNDDLLAVLDAVGSERSSLLCEVDGSLCGLLFAATHPDRTNALVLWNGYARDVAAPDYPEGYTPEQLARMTALFLESWGTERMGRLAQPDRDPSVWRIEAKWQRSSLTPAGVVRRLDALHQMDVRDALRTIAAPALVLHSEGNGFVPASWSRHIADRMPNARFVSVPGSEALLLDNEVALRSIEHFLTGVDPPAPSDRVLATLLFTDCVGSTEQAALLGDRQWRQRLDAHDTIVRSVIDRAGGRLVSTAGDGVLATFDGPGRAIGCARQLRRELREVGLEIRAGLHSGEIELLHHGDIGGLAVHIAARVMATAGDGEIWCSRTVKDLVVGSGLEFADRGVRVLKGIPDPWQVFAVVDG